MLDINTENNDGNTALHLCASSFETVGITETLLKHGAKMTQNKHGLSPLQVAALRLLYRSEKVENVYKEPERRVLLKYSNDSAHFFLPIFTAAKDEKYFSLSQK